MIRFSDDWAEELFPDNLNSELGQRLGISYVRTLQETVDVLVRDSVLKIEQSSLGMTAISCVVWDCGLLLVDFLCTCEQYGNDPSTLLLKVLGTSVLEIGCGTGLVGLSALSLGASNLLLTDIVFTDGLERTIEGSSVAQYIHYDWSNEIIPTQLTESSWDLVLCSDVLYESKNHAGLLRLVENLKFSKLLFAYKRRHDIEEKLFFESLANTCTIRVVDSQSIILRNLSKTALPGLFIVVVEPK